MSEKLEALLSQLRGLNETGEPANGAFITIRYSIELTNEIKQETEFLNESYGEMEIGQRVWHLREGIFDLVRCTCGTKKALHRYSSGYHSTCGKPSCKNSAKVKKGKETQTSKYPEGHHTRTQEFKDKYESTMLERHGVSHNWSGKLHEKSEETMLAKYGSRHALNIPEFKDKREKTCIDTHGTMDFLNCEKTKSTNLLRYGAENAMKNPDVSKKVSEAFVQLRKEELEEKLKQYSLSLIKRDLGSCELFCDVCNKQTINHPGTINAKLRNSINPCSHCNPLIKTHSVMEKDLAEFIKSIYPGTIIENTKKLVLYEKYAREIDIYLPDEGIAFEFNGLYWHNELNKSPESHSVKTEQCLGKGISLYHVWEDDWTYRNDVVKGWIRGILNINNIGIDSNLCEIREVSQRDYLEFCEANHIQGYCRANIVIGLYNGDLLVSCISLSRPRRQIAGKTDVEYEIIRSCNRIGYSVSGGVSRLFTHFVKEYKPDSILTYSDASFSPDPNKSIYTKLGFQFQVTSDPGYCYVVDGVRRNRLNYQKSMLVKQGFPLESTEVEIMNSRGYYRIFDCGSHKFIWRNEVSKS